MIIVHGSKTKFKVLGKVTSGEPGDFEVIVKCPHCQQSHIHRWVSAGDIRFCAHGKGKYQIYIPQENAEIVGKFINAYLTVNCPACGNKHHHGKNGLRIGDRIHLIAHCGLGSYYVSVVGGGK